jgi:hypothetical protein
MRVGFGLIALITVLDIAAADSGEIGRCKAHQPINPKPYTVRAELVEAPAFYCKSLPRRTAPFNPACGVAQDRLRQAQREWRRARIKPAIMRNI